MILVYDISDKNSFNNLKKWNELIEKNAKKGIIKILVGNKCDKIDRVVSEEEGENFAMDNNYIFCETSARNDINVKEVFNLISKKILKAVEENKLIYQMNPRLVKKSHDKKNCFII